jgi:signal transduction histidine kinase
MRRRLMVALVGLVAVVLVIAGAGSLLLTRSSARHQATQQLITEAQALTSGENGTQSLAVLKVIRKVLTLEDATSIVISAAGVITSALPPGLTVADMDPPRLLAGQTVSGRDNNLVFAAAPVTLSPTERLRITRAIRPRVPFRGAIAVVLTRQVGDLGPSWTYFIIAGGGALLIAALVAWQLSRRMARPLVEAMEVTGRIASGDLQSRVPTREGDYSEFASLAHSINEMAQSLEDSRTRERHLLLSVSHDLRTPLTSIRGFAEAITDGAAQDNAQAAEVIIAEARRLERLVGDLLDLTKLESHQLSITMRPSNAAEVVSTTTEGFRPMAERTGLALLVRVPAQPGPAVAADPDRLAQLLANLIENAITFARTTVIVTLFDPGAAGAHIITVEDDGPGIAPGDLTRVFERFYRADRGPNRLVGSGLGLAIVAELAAAMGSTVWAESPATLEGGSRFVVTLAPWRA